MRNYAASDVMIAWFGLLRLEDGLAQGTFVQESRANPQWIQKPDGMGEVVQMYHPNTHGFLTLNFDRETRQHLQLITLANADIATRSIVGPMFITDKNTNAVQLYNKARISVKPNYLAGSGPSVVPWVFIFSQSIGQVFGANDNVVGS